MGQVMKAHKRRNKKANRKLQLLRRLLLVILALAIIVGGGTWFYTYTHPLKLKESVIKQEMGDPFDPADHIKKVWFGKPEEVSVKSDVDVSKEGDYPVVFTWRNHSEKAVVQVRDTTPPDLEVKDYATDMIEEVKPEMFVERVEDRSEVTVRFAEGQSLDEEGTHAVEILAEDASGNQTEKEAQLTRTKDTQKPEIQGVEDMTVKQGKTIDFSQGVTVTDDMDPNPVLEIHSEKVDLAVPGTYQAVYTAKDRSGNQAEIVQNITVEANPEWDAKIVYLTFDDGPSENTKKILDILDQYQAKATFFVTGNNQKKNDLIRQAHEKGHSIGLHTYTHDYASVYSSEEAYFKDLQEISDMVEELTGEKSRLIRFPGGSSNTISKKYVPGLMTRLTQAVQEKGYQYFDWNCDSTDASGNNVPEEKLIAAATSSSAKHINILMHDTDAKNTTVKALPKIIEHYRKLGYAFKGLTVDSYAPHHHVNN